MPEKNKVRSKKVITPLTLRVTSRQMEDSEKQKTSPAITVSAPPCSLDHLTHHRSEAWSKTFPLRKSTALINLAKGYDKFKQSFLSLPAEFGFASSDDTKAPTEVVGLSELLSLTD